MSRTTFYKKGTNFGAKIQTTFVYDFVRKSKLLCFNLSQNLIGSRLLKGKENLKIVPDKFPFKTSMKKLKTVGDPCHV